MRLRASSRFRGLAGLIAGVLVGIAITGTALALKSSSFTYSRTKTGYYSLSPMDFAPDSLHTPTNDYHKFWIDYVDPTPSPTDDSFVWRLGNTDTARCFNAGVHLPKGAKMKSITFWYESGDLYGDLHEDDFYGVLVRQNPSTNAAAAIAAVAPIDDSGVKTPITALVESTKQTVNNQAFTYGVGVCVAGDTYFYGARIKYTYKNAGD